MLCTSGFMDDLVFAHNGQGPDVQNILRQSDDYLTIMPKLRSTCDGRLICKTSYKERKAFLRYDSVQSRKIVLRFLVSQLTIFLREISVRRSSLSQVDRTINLR